MRGQCLCGAVAFEFHGPATAIELCHCRNCKRATGSAFAAGFYVRVSDFRWTRGQELISTYEAPLREKPPPYRRSFCKVCGSLLPAQHGGGLRVEIPAGLVEGDFGSRLAYSIWLGRKAPWWETAATLPGYEESAPLEVRARLFSVLESEG